MSMMLLTTLALLLGANEPLGPGKHERRLTIGEVQRSYLVYVPPGYDAAKPMPVVVALHGAAMNGQMMEGFSGLSRKADKAGFIVVYPNGTGLGGVVLTWNSGAFPGKFQNGTPDDVGFIDKMLDDLANVVNLDRSRVYATGMSNGAMMAYRLAAELPDRFAAIAPVAGTMVLEDPQLKKPMPILHIHGTGDTLVPFDGAKNKNAEKLFRFLPVEESLKPWLEVNGCPRQPTVTELPRKADKLKVTHKAWTNCTSGADVHLYIVEGGGHAWPGMGLHAEFLGPNTFNISANDLMWEFFQRHTKK